MNNNLGKVQVRSSRLVEVGGLYVVQLARSHSVMFQYALTSAVVMSSSPAHVRFPLYGLTFRRPIHNKVCINVNSQRVTGKT